MVNQNDIDKQYMETAFGFSKLSHAKRKKVGALLVIPEGGRFEGINGMPSGFDNVCEMTVEQQQVTKPETLHAESNAIAKVARSTQSTIGATMYCTLSPCLECAKLIIQCGIIRVVYAEQYPYPGHTGTARAIGLDLLRKAKIQVDNVPLVPYNTDDELTLQDEGRFYDSGRPWQGYKHS